MNIEAAFEKTVMITTPTVILGKIPLRLSLPGMSVIT